MQTVSLSIRKAEPDEAGALTELAMRSKAHWGYAQDFLDACRPELTVDPGRFGSEDFRCFVAVDRDLVLGFYSLQRVSEDEYELDALFVEPKHIGKGIGRWLIEHAVSFLSEQGAARMIIQGDPNAGDFYVAAGARRIGHRESGSIPGRQLPLYEIVFGH